MYLRGTKQNCEAYNTEVTQGRGYNNEGIKWAKVIERDGEYYIRKHPEYPATSGLIEADLPEPEGIDGI